MNRSLRIVVADDDASFQEIYKTILTSLGHTVAAVAENGRQLVEHCRSESPELIISDIKMQDMDGIDAAKEICRSEAVPIILVSSYHDKELIERASSDFILGYLIKPIRKADLETAIAIAMRRFEEYQVLRMEADHYRQTLANRKIIERAKGILMKKTGITEADAFQRLQTLAREKNRKLIDIAQSVLTAEEAFG